MPVHTAGLLAAVAVLCPASARAIFLLYRYGGGREVRCPESSRRASVRPRFWRVLWTGMAGQPKLSLASCSEWPERQSCGQQCLGQVDLACRGRLLRAMVSRWYAGRKCFYCDTPFASGSGPEQAVLVAGRTVEVSAIPAGRLPILLAKAKPVCFACHAAHSGPLESTRAAAKE